MPVETRTEASGVSCVGEDRGLGQKIRPVWRLGRTSWLVAPAVGIAGCLLMLAVGATGCGSPGPDRSNVGRRQPRPRAAVIVNAVSPISRRIAVRFAEARHLPPSHRLEIEVSPEEQIPLETYRLQIEEPVRLQLEERGLRDSVDFLVLTKGIPIRIEDDGRAVDALLGGMDITEPPGFERLPPRARRLPNPYHGRREPFSRARWGFYLVTRLDGDTEEDALALIDRSLKARPEKGPFLLDLDPGMDSPGYRVINDAMRRAAEVLQARRFDVHLTDRGFSDLREPLAGYYSWGSNDGAFDSLAWGRLRFLPGALAETGVSTSARTFQPTTGGQSRIADLIAQGVTGVRGYVSEPTVAALARADILFERYTSGFTLAESFGMASPVLRWKGIVLGDPLCAPYAETR